MSTSTWTGAFNRDWDDADNWSPAGVPDASSDVVITTGPSVQVSASIGTVNSITDLYALGFESAGTNTVATFLDITGHLYVDSKAGAGGTILNIGGTLTNRHHLTIGNATLSAPDEVTAASLEYGRCLAQSDRLQRRPGAPRRDRRRGLRHGGRPERRCASVRRQRYRVCER